MRDVYAKFSVLLDKHLAEEVLIVALAAVFMVLAQSFGLMP